VEHIDSFDHTAQFYAARNGNTSAITSLIKKHAPTDDGSLHEAARELHAEALKMLIAAGHKIDYPSLKHGGRSPLCELCYKCRPAANPISLQNTIVAIITAKATPLRKYRDKTAIFYAMENEDPVPVVQKLIEKSLWQDLNDEKNVVEVDSHFYSPTMYIKKGLIAQTEVKAKQVLIVLQDASAEDRFYAKERMQQPADAVGMPQRIADMDRKKWIRTSKMEEEQEDHRRKLRREQEEMEERDKWTTQRHILEMEHREEVASQTTDITGMSRMQQLQFRSREHALTSRYKDDLLDHRLDEVAGSHRLKFLVDEQTRGQQLQHDSIATQQRLGYLDQEQDIKLGGSQAQQNLRLDGMHRENSLKGEAMGQDLWFKEQRSGVDRADMDYRLQHTVDMSADRLSTQERAEEIAKIAHQRKNYYDQESQQAQLGFQSASDQRKLMTEDTMNRYRRSNNDDTIRTRETLGQIDTRTLQDKHQLTEQDRQNQARFNVTTDNQKMGTLRETGRINNDTLFHKGRIENDSLRAKNDLMHQNRNNELQHTADMGVQKTENERNLGAQKYSNERDMGEIRVTNEKNMGEMKVTNETNLGKAKAQTERLVGDEKVTTENEMGQARAQSERMVGGQKVANENMVGQARAQSERKVGQEKMRTTAGVNNINNQGARYRNNTQCQGAAFRANLNAQRGRR